MLFKTRPLASGVWRALGIAGGASLFIAFSTNAFADDAAASAPATTAATDAATAPVAAPGETKKEAATPAKARQLGAVVVTAQRRAEKIQDVPTTVTAVNGERFTDTGAGSSAANVTKYVANTSAGQTAPTRPRWWIRGVGTGAQGFDVQSPIGIYFDDVYFSNANATGQPVYDLQRVEVLEGPQGTLWGKNTTGGAINFVSVKPSFTPSGYAKIDRDSNSKELFEAAYGGSLIDDRLAARASFHAESAPGDYKNVTTGAKETQFHDNAGRIQFLGKVTPDFSALLNVHFRDYYGNGNNWTVIGAGPNGKYYNSAANGAVPAQSFTPDPAKDAVSSNAPNTAQIHQDGISLTLSAPLGRNQLTSITAFEGFQTTAFSDSDDTSLEISRGYNAGVTHQLSQELRLASPRSDRFNWVTGAIFFTENISSDTVAAVLPYAATGVTPGGIKPSFRDTLFAQDTKSYSLFGSSTYNFTDKLNVTAGLRYTSEKKEDDLVIRSASAALGNATSVAPYNNVATWWLPTSVNGLAVTGTQAASKTWGAWTYDLTPEYRLTDNARAYFRYAHGFRAGGFNSSATSAANVGIVNPEYITSYEIGAKSEWLDGQLIVNGDIFYYNFDDMQVNAVTGGTSLLTNAGKGKANGAELTIEAIPTENLHLRLNSALLNTKFVQYTTGGIDYSGNRFVRSPRLSDVFSADYRFGLPNGHELQLATDWKYQSKYYFYTNDQVDANVTQAGFTQGDVRLSYIVDKITWTAYVNNVTDKIYKQHTLLQTNSTAPSANPIYLGGDTVSWSEGRVFGASFTTRF